MLEVDQAQRSGPASPQQLWAGLDGAWRLAFREAWEAFRRGDIPVGACATTSDGRVLHSSRNRVLDSEGPEGELFGSALAHAEINVLARLPFRSERQVILTSTLEPCLQCSAAARLGPVCTLRFAGSDPLWHGCHDFSPLSEREASRAKMELEGPRQDELGALGTLIAAFWPHRESAVAFLREHGQGAYQDLALELEREGMLTRLRSVEVDSALAALWPRLEELCRGTGAA